MSFMSIIPSFAMNEFPVSLSLFENTPFSIIVVFAHFARAGL